MRRETTTISPVTDIVAELKAGRMVVLVDEEDRENEGDLDAGRRARHPRGDQFHGQARARPDLPDADRSAHCRQIDLPLMVRDNRARMGTNFTLSIEAAEGVTTGISAARPRAHRAGRGGPSRQGLPTSCSPATSSR